MGDKNKSVNIFELIQMNYEKGIVTKDPEALLMKHLNDNKNNYQKVRNILIEMGKTIGAVLNPLALSKIFYDYLQENHKSQNNMGVFKQVLTGKVLCLPKTIGSTTGGLVIQTICSMKINPRAMLFSESIDSLACSGIVLAKNWENSDIIAIDRLGVEFLSYVETGDTIQIKNDGTVTVVKK